MGHGALRLHTEAIENGAPAPEVPTGKKEIRLPVPAEDAASWALKVGIELTNPKVRSVPELDGTWSVVIPELAPSASNRAGVTIDEMMEKIRRNPRLVALLVPDSPDSMDPLTEKILRAKLERRR